MATIGPQPENEVVPPTVLVGRDEMNLAEFPIALLADRVPKGQKTLYFEDRHGRLTVTGSDAYGLPTATDTDVIVALLYLTKLRNGFSDVKVNFSRYELINLLNWHDEGGSYQRLDQSFHRWSGVLLVYDKCWWNNKTKKYVSANMHIIDSVIFAEPGGRNKGGQSHLQISIFTWNKTFIESCQADNLRQLDLETYFSLKSAVSKRLYRFLGKRFYLQSDYQFDLNEIAFDRVGLSRNYESNAGKIKEKLQPAIEELEAIGFLLPLSREDRYTRIDRGRWTIRLAWQFPTLVTPQRPGPAAIPPEPPPPPPLTAELISRGVTEKAAAELVRKHPAELIGRKIDVFDWLTEKEDKRVAHSPAGYLVKSIDDDYAAPKGFISKADRQARDLAKQAKERQAAADHARVQREKARDKAQRRAVAAYWESLTPEQQASLDAASLALADPDSLAFATGPLSGMSRQIRRADYIRRLLAGRESPPTA